MKKFIIGSRQSPLALTQTNLVVEAIAKKFPEIKFEIKPIITKGDKVKTQPLRDVYGDEGKGAFTIELSQKLLDKEFDFVVHSMKDVAGNYKNPQLTFAAYIERSSPFDALITKNADYKSLKDLPKNTKIGTVSLRRKAAILKENPNLIVENLRGTVQTRIQKLHENFDAIIMAEAAIIRSGENLNLSGLYINKISDDIMLPAAAQGAIGIECRENDTELKNILSQINHQPTYYTTECERAFLAEINGNCFSIIGCLAEISGDVITLKANISDESGKYLFSLTQSDKDTNYKKLGTQLAKNLKQKITSEMGNDFLKEVLHYEC
jgi:hydroxymethylbilane synthase